MLTYKSSPHITQIRFTINRLQIDNQLPDHIFEVAFSPVIVPKSISDNFDINNKGFIEASAIIQKLGSVTRYKVLAILIQEFMVQLDWGWVSQITDVLDFEPKEESTKTLIVTDLEEINSVSRFLE